MKKVIFGTLAGLLVAASALADTCATNLIPLFTPAQATKLCASYGSSLGTSLKPQTDNTYDLGSASKQWRTAYLGTNLVFGAASAKIIPGATSLLFRNNADSSTNVTIADAGTVTTRAGITATTGDITATAGDLSFGAASASIKFGATSGLIKVNGNTELTVGDNLLIHSAGTGGFVFRTDTSDAADNSSIQIAGGGGTSTSRGANVLINGNEEATGLGSVSVTGGALATGHINFVTAHATPDINFKPNGTLSWKVTGAGLLQNAAAGADVALSQTGTTVSIQEGTAASACSGTLTANGGTPVVTSTTCAKTGSRIFLTRTSAETGVVSAWISAITDATSFAITGEAGDTGTYNWIIFHEAP